MTVWRIKYLTWRFMLVLLAASLLSSCAGDQVHSTAHHSDISLNKGELEAHGLAFITPSTVTGQEEDKQTLAFIFAEVMNKERPEIQTVSLPQTLSAINKAGFADSYKVMYDDYGDTGIFRYDILKKVGKVTGARYLAQLKLSNFSQESKSLFYLLGLRLIQTKDDYIRMFLQIWNCLDGSIVWEGTEEVTYAWESGSAKPVTFRIVVEETAQNLISHLP